MRLGLAGSVGSVATVAALAMSVMSVVSAAGALAACSGSDGATIDATSDAGNGTTGVKAGGTKGSGDAGGDDEDDDASMAGGGGEAGGSKGDAGAAADGGHPVVDAGPPSGHETGQKLTVDGATRTYDISVPLQCTASTKVPLVFILHGDGGKGSDMYGSAFPIEAAAAAAGDEAIFVYPDGLNNNQNGSAWNIYDNPSVFPYDGGDPTKNDDVDYFDALVKSLGAMACADPSRVFVTGFSNGGYMTNQLARWRAGVVKAAAPQSGGPPAGSTDSDYPTAPYCVGVTGAVPTLIVHGTNDGTVDFSLGQQAASYWDIANGCAKASSDCSSSSNTLVTPPVTPTTATSPSPCVTSTGCMTGEPVISCFISGMGHQIWSAAPTAIWALFASVSGS